MVLDVVTYVYVLHWEPMIVVFDPRTRAVHYCLDFGFAGSVYVVLGGGLNVAVHRSHMRVVAQNY